MGEKFRGDMRRGFQALIPIPVPTGEQRQRLFEQEPPLWLVLSRWVQYYSTQLRWDIERFFARRFNRRWGVK